MRMPLVPLSAFILLAGIVTPPRSMQGKDVTIENRPQDRIAVIGHFTLAAGPVEHLQPTQHYSRYYLYAEHVDGNVTVIDVTDAASPSLVADAAFPANLKSDALMALTGTAALAVSSSPSPSAETPQTVRILNFSDPAHPKVSREFSGITAIGRDSRRGFVFLADGDGIWILQQRFAEDPAVESAYADQLLYDH